MLKTGRNQTCPCGSGKKYKRCHSDADEEARRLEREEARRKQLEATDELERLTEESNLVVALIRAGELDEAEARSHRLLVDYPDVLDGHMRLGAVFKARGDAKRAAEHLRLAAAMARTPDFDDDLAASLESEADALDPPAR